MRHLFAKRRSSNALEVDPSSKHDNYRKQNQNKKNNHHHQHRPYQHEEEKKQDTSHEVRKQTIALDKVSQAAVANTTSAAAAPPPTTTETQPVASNVDVGEPLQSQATTTKTINDFPLTFPDHDDEDDVVFDDNEESNPFVGISSYQQADIPKLTLPVAVRPVGVTTVSSPVRVRGGPVDLDLVGDDNDDDDDEEEDDDKDDDQSVLPLSIARPPSEINIEFGCIPPTSPMRDPSVIFEAARRLTQPGGNHHHEGGATPDLLLGGAGDGMSITDLDYQLELGLQTKLSDAERLVRVILGRSEVPTTAGPYANLEHGSILRAIRTFAIMKKELLDLRQHQESNDGDPPAILTNLPSPATTSDCSFPDTLSPLPSLLSPGTAGVRSEDKEDEDHHEHDHDRQLKVMRNALILAAKKCHSLERELEQAKETIEKVRQEPGTSHVPPSTALAEVEDILRRLQSVPVSSMSGEEQKKIRNYITDILVPLRDQQEQAALRESRRAEEEARQELEAAKKQIAELKARLSSSSSRKGILGEGDGDDDHHQHGIPNPLLELRRNLYEKDERIAQLEATQVRFQTLMQMAVSTSSTTSTPIQECRWPPMSSERLRALEKEHQELADSVRRLEGQAVHL